jgi:hypothetical protein
MSLKKELLSQLSLQQLKELAEKKGLSFALNDTQKKYYEEWSERDRIIDLISDNQEISIREIEDHIKFSHEQ